MVIADAVNCAFINADPPGIDLPGRTHEDAVSAFPLVLVLPGARRGQITAPDQQARPPVVGAGRIAAGEAFGEVQRCREVVIVSGVHQHAGHDLFLVRHAAALLRLGAGPVQGRQQHGGENRDDGDNNQKFDQSEGASCGFHGGSLLKLFTGRQCFRVR